MLNLKLKERSASDAVAAILEAVNRARQHVNQPDSRAKDARLKILEQHEGFGPLFKPIVEDGFGKRRHIPEYLRSIGVCYNWQLCTRTREEFAELHLGSGLLRFDNTDLDQMVIYLALRDLSFAPRR